MSRVERLDPRTIDAIQGWPLFDNAIVQHSYTRYMRDYDVIVEAGAATPDGTGSYLEGRYRFRFTHCVLVNVVTTVDEQGWTKSWSEEYTDYGAWERAGNPKGYVWGVQYMEAYPGGRYISDSPLASDWTRRLGRAMHEVAIQTNAHLIQLVFHRLLLHKVAQGDHVKRILSEIEPVEILGDAG